MLLHFFVTCHHKPLIVVFIVASKKLKCKLQYKLFYCVEMCQIVQSHNNVKREICSELSMII